MEVFVSVTVQWLSIQQDLTLLWLIEPLQEADEGSLSTARGTHQGCDLPRLQVH